MKILLNEFSEDAHRNAVRHGFWEGGKADETVLALIHSEWSEALESYRNGEALVWQECHIPMAQHPCEGEACNALEDDASWQNCSNLNPKPEGTAVELIDGCIRILDAVAAWAPGKYLGDSEFEDVHSVGNLSLETIAAMELPQLVALLHYQTSEAYKWLVHFCERAVAVDKLMGAVAAVFAWVRANGQEPEEIMDWKHNYNTTRPYMHGGKRI